MVAVGEHHQRGVRQPDDLILVSDDDVVRSKEAGRIQGSDLPRAYGELPQHREVRLRAAASHPQGVELGQNVGESRAGTDNRGDAREVGVAGVNVGDEPLVLPPSGSSVPPAVCQRFFDGVTARKEAASWPRNSRNARKDIDRLADHVRFGAPRLDRNSLHGTFEARPEGTRLPCAWMY